MTGKLNDRIPKLFYHQRDRYVRGEQSDSSSHSPHQPGHQVQKAEKMKHLLPIPFRANDNPNVINDSIPAQAAQESVVHGVSWKDPSKYPAEFHCQNVGTTDNTTIRFQN